MLSLYLRAHMLIARQRALADEKEKRKNLTKYIPDVSRALFGMLETISKEAEDDGDDAAYKYTLAGALESSFALTSANADPTGITTNGSQIWVVDAADLKIYSYRTDGVYISAGDIPLTGPNADPQGITVRSK